MKNVTQEAGFTLLELMAVLAIYALIAIVSLQVLSGALRNQGRAELAMNDATEAVAVLTVLRRDLEAMAPAAASLATGPGPFSSEAGGRIRIIRASQASGAGDGIEAVEWYVDRTTGTLWRIVGEPEGYAAPKAVRMLEGLETWNVQTLSEQGDWVSANSWHAADVGDFPRAVEVLLRTAALGDLRLVATR